MTTGPYTAFVKTAEGDWDVLNDHAQNSFDSPEVAAEATVLLVRRFVRRGDRVKEIRVERDGEKVFAIDATRIPQSHVSGAMRRTSLGD